MGFMPEEVGRMDLWELRACLDGVRRANSPPDEDDDPEPPTPEVFRAMVARHLGMQGKHVGP